MGGKDLTGQWQWQKEECVTKDRQKIFRNTREELAYRLVFQGREVQLDYPEQNLTQATGYEGSTCDVIVKGVHERTLTGKLKMNFKDASGGYQVQPCHDLKNLELKDEEIPDRLYPYFSGQALEVKEHPVGELQITLPGVSYCENEKLKVFFKKRH